MYAVQASGEVTLANFPPADGYVPWPEAQLAHLVWTDGAVWRFKELGRVAPGTTFQIRETDLPADLPNDASPFFTLNPGELPAAADTLPKARHMATVPAWRANIKLSSAKTAVAYQGEYSGGMASIPKGTLFTAGPLGQFGNGLRTHLFLVNLRDSPEVTDGEIRLFELGSNRCIATFPARTNHVNSIDLTDAMASAEDQVYLVSHDLTGIPIYFTHNSDYSEMSLEHTHPPMEMVLFGKRHLHQQAMKRWWLETAS